MGYVERPSGWRPTHDLGNRFNVWHDEPPFEPKTIPEAVAFISALGLQEIADYAGSPETQTVIIKEVAEREYPELFHAVRLELVNNEGVA